MKEQWCIPPEANAAFVCRMEDILEVYTHPYDPDYPVVCMDEMPKQLLGDIREPMLMQSGQSIRIDHTYSRNGAADLFMFCEPLAGKRHVMVENRRRRLEWAEGMRLVAEELYPAAKKIIMVLDNLNTHDPASFYQAYEPEVARRLSQRFEFHFTPKHGSWLNIAEIELGALARQCLQRRIPDLMTLQKEIQAWQNQRNSQAVKVHWQFTSSDARIKLGRLYPKNQA